jgi:hypothetical protein
MHGIILLYLFAFALGFHVSQMMTTYAIINRSNKSRRSKYKKCHYVNSLFPNTCPTQPFDGYKNLYEKSYQMELLEFHNKECFLNENLFGALVLFFLIIILFMNCLCF